MTTPLAQLSAAIGSRYSIERELGAGGSAVVYLARDRKHDRPVALKVLRPELAAALGTQRFLNEIAITAKLHHPHILTLIDSGEADGFLYYVLPYVQGASLRDRLAAERQLGIEEALTITTQVAGALEAAHRMGILHRDIKPENILFQDGQAVLTDFGIALATSDVGERLTEDGGWLGTPHYMSVEQATGERELDPSSDTYSLACVLYEMLAGEPPYTGRTAQALLAKRMIDPVPRVRRLRATVPPAVEAAITRALALAPADRYATVAEFVAALAAPAELAPGERQAVAVLPFLSLSSDPENEFFADGITEDVIAHLAKIRSLSVISRASVMPFKDRDRGQDLADIAARLQATTLLDGSVRRAGDRVRIVVQLVDPATGRDLWSETYDRELHDIFAIQTDVALRIAHTLEAQLSPEEDTRIRKEPTTDLGAYRLYLQGRHWALREELHRAIGYFEEAIAADPTYAMAQVGIAMAYQEMGEIGLGDSLAAYRRARDAATRALELDEELGEAHSIRGYLMVLLDFDWAGGEREFQRALELSPGGADIHDLYGRMCGAMLRFDEAVELTRRARDLDPLAHRVDMATMLLRAGRDEEALTAASQAVEFDPEYIRARATMGWALIRTGEVERGIHELRNAAEGSGGASLWSCQLAQALALHGHADEARAILATFEARARHEFVSPYHLAYIHTGLGDHDRALDILTTAIEQRAAASYGTAGSFLFEPLRSHPRFEQLLRQLRLA